MRSKNIKIKPLCLGTVLLLVLGNLSTVQAFTSYELDSDLNYKYSGAEAPEFYNSGTTAYNYNGTMPYYLQQIYGVNNESVYNSNFGTNIIDLNGYGTYSYNTYGYGYGIDYGNYNASVEGNYFDSVAGGGQYYNVNVDGNGSQISNNTNVENTSNSNIGISYTDNNGVVNGVLPNEVGDVTFPSYFADTNYSYNNNLSTNKDVVLSRYSDGRIGTITVDNANLEVKAFDYSDIYESMKKGVGHLDSTAYWNGNVVFFGHNRGSNGYFNKLKNVSKGDIVTYTTKEGTKKYKVNSIKYIDETDWSDLGYSSTNKITLITCVENKPGIRLFVQGVEVQ